MSPDDFVAFPTGNLCNADPRVQALPSALRPLLPGRRIAGTARTASISPGQNGAIHRAVHRAAPGEVLVVAGGASPRFGPFGDLLADACKVRGMVGAVLDCTYRDSTDIAALGFQVFGRGTHPEATGKAERGEIDVPVTIGGIEIAPGDIIVGDDDGVVVFPASAAEEILAAVIQVADRETRIRTRILAGESTLDIFGLAP